MMDNWAADVTAHAAWKDYKKLPRNQIRKTGEPHEAHMD